MALRTEFPAVRACLFDMDGVLIDTEDIYSICVNIVLKKYNRPKLPWDIKAKLQGRPGPVANKIFHEWAELPISQEEFVAEYCDLQRQLFPGLKALRGVADLLADLNRTRYWEVKDNQKDGSAKNSDYDKNSTGAPKPQRVHIALATSSHLINFQLKTSHLTELFSAFAPNRRILGDDPRIPQGRGKPMPDIYLLALKSINDSLAPGERPIAPDECLVLEDSVPGVEAGRRAGMRVVWVPHPMLRVHYTGREAEVLAGQTGEGGDVDLHQLGTPGDGWGKRLETLVDFPYAKYGIVVPPKEVEEEPCMKKA